MKVFKIIPHTGYAGGNALIAAKDTEEAINLFCSDDYSIYIYDVNNCTCNLVVGLDYDTTIPHVLWNDIYIE